MLIKDIPISTRVELIFKGEKGIETASSRIVDYEHGDEYGNECENDVNCILISQPTINRRTLDIKEGCVKMICVYKEQAIEWDCINDGKINRDNLVIYRLKRDKDGIKVNNREVFRFRLFEVVKFKRPNDDTVYMAATKDISLKGICFISEEELNIGEIITVKFRRSNYNIEAEFRVVRKVDNSWCYEYGSELLESNRIIEKLMYALQREYMLKRNSSSFMT